MRVWQRPQRTSGSRVALRKRTFRTTDGARASSIYGSEDKTKSRTFVFKRHLQTTVTARFS